MAVALKENERLFGDSALGMVSSQLCVPAGAAAPRGVTGSLRSGPVPLVPAARAGPPALAGLCLTTAELRPVTRFSSRQSIRTPKVAFRYFQDLLGKRVDNPHVALYRSRFPEHELVKDEKRQTVIFRLSP